MPEVSQEELIRILLVEDDPDLVTALTSNLSAVTNARAYVSAARTLSEALSVLPTERLDVVLLDLGLPDSAGLNTLNRVHGAAPSVPIVVLTGESDEAIAIQAARCGAEDYLVKGRVDDRALLRAIRYSIERKRAQAALRRSEEHLRLALAAARMGIWRWAPEDDRLTISESFLEQLGIEAGARAGSIAELLGAVHPDDRDIVRSATDAIRLRPARQRLELTFRLLAAGATVWVQCTGRRLAGGETGPREFMGTITDVTAHKELEGQLLQSQKLESIGRLAGGVAHDFNNLLTVILGAACLTERDPTLSPQARQHQESIRDAAERAARLTGQLLVFARKQAVQLTSLDVGQVVLGMQDMLRRLLGEDVRLAMRVDPDLGCVRADRARLEQVLVNLAVNARDAMPDGGDLEVVVAMHARQPEEEGAPEVVRIIVRDTGVGMDPATLERAFEPFFTTKGAKGTGFGLATSYGIVAQLGGRITAESAVGVGTTFTVDLPSVEGRPAGAARARSPAAPSGVIGATPRTVLVVEDDPHVRALAVSSLSVQGHRVLSAGDAEEALELLHSHGSIDLLLTDVILPSMSGRRLAAAARALRRLEVLFMSGYTGGVLAPGEPFLQKPFTPDDLARAVAAALEGASRPGH